MLNELSMHSPSRLHSEWYSMASTAATPGPSHRKGAKSAKEREMEKTKEDIERVAKQVVDAMLTVHRELGPGLLESTYQACLAHELRSRGIEVHCEIELPVRSRGRVSNRHAGRGLRDRWK